MKAQAVVGIIVVLVSPIGGEVGAQKVARRVADARCFQDHPVVAQLQTVVAVDSPGSLRVAEVEVGSVVVSGEVAVGKVVFQHPAGTLVGVAFGNDVDDRVAFGIVTRAGITDYLDLFNIGWWEGGKPIIGYAQTIDKNDGGSLAEDADLSLGIVHHTGRAAQDFIDRGAGGQRGVFNNYFYRAIAPFPHQRDFGLHHHFVQLVSRLP